MSEAPETLRLARLWVEKAEEDLFVAVRLLSPDENCPFSTICFHAQQSVEKYVKALLVSMAIAFPKVHDIGELLKLAPASIEIPLSTEEQEQLTFYATTARYPGEYEPISRGEAEEMMAAAKKLRDAVRAHLPKGALNIPNDPPLPQ
jgi:HEPN domain-containing protein